MTSKRRRMVIILAVFAISSAVAAAYVFHSGIWRTLFERYDSKPYELYVMENDPRATDLSLDHEVIERVSSDVMFMYNYYLALESEDLETIESRWDEFQSEEYVSRILEYFSKEILIGDSMCLVTIRMLDRDQFKHLPEVVSRMESFHTIHNGRDYAMARCGFRTYGCGSGTLTWRGGIYDGATLMGTMVYFSQGRVRFCIVTTVSREICIIYNEEGTPKRVLQVLK